LDEPPNAPELLNCISVVEPPGEVEAPKPTSTTPVLVATPSK